MTQEEKTLLLKDLCARLPYGIKCKITSIKKEEIKTLFIEQVGVFKRNNCNIYPYLRSMETMTEDEREEYENLCLFYGCKAYSSNTAIAYELIDWLNKNMFDYRGLIPMGLALEAKEDIYIK